MINLIKNFKPSGNESDIVYHQWLTDYLKNKYNENIKILGVSYGNGKEKIILHKYKNSKIFSCVSITFTRCINDKEVTIILIMLLKTF